MNFIPGKQELLILLVDSSSSMYVEEDSSGQTVSVNKYNQVQNAIQSLIKQINISNKQNNILISIVPFAERTVTLKPDGLESKYYQSKTWIENENIQNLFALINNFSSPKRTAIGHLTSFISAFSEAKTIVDSLFTDDRIAPENRHGISIMFFSDGWNYPKSDTLLSNLETIIAAIKGSIEVNIVDKLKRDNFSISSIAIGKEADEITMKTISTPYSIKQEKHISDLRKKDMNASMCVDEYRCYLKLNANNNTITDHELRVLRKFLFLVTETQ
jgi:hypothetical protein